MARTIKLYKLPDKPKTPGIRPLEKRDVPQVCAPPYKQSGAAHAWSITSFCYCCIGTGCSFVQAATVCPASAELSLQLCSACIEALHDNIAVNVLASMALFLHVQILWKSSSGLLACVIGQVIVTQVTRLLSTYLEKYSLIPIFTEEEVEHYLMPVEDVVDSYVVESAGQPTEVTFFVLVILVVSCLLKQACVHLTLGDDTEGMNE